MGIRRYPSSRVLLVGHMEVAEEAIYAKAWAALHVWLGWKAAALHAGIRQDCAHVQDCGSIGFGRASLPAINWTQRLQELEEMEPALLFDCKL